MSQEVKDLFKEIGISTAGTVFAAGLLTGIAFLAGKINLVVVYWKGILVSLFLIFVTFTLTIFFRRLLKLEEAFKKLKLQQTITQPNYSKDIASIKADLAKKADRNSVPDNNSFKNLKRTVKELEAFKYGQKGQKGELITLIELLKEDIDADSWQIDGVLQDIEKAMNGVELKEDMIIDIEEQLCRLDGKPKYNILIKKIRKHYQD